MLQTIESRTANEIFGLSSQVKSKNYDIPAIGVVMFLIRTLTSDQLSQSETKQNMTEGGMGGCIGRWVAKQGNGWLKGRWVFI
jgi:hypothetical protein